MHFLDESQTTSTSVQQFMYRVYAWMGVALALSGMVAYWVGSNPAIALKIAQNPFLLFGILIAQFVIIFAINPKLTKFDYPVVATLFIIYALLTGLTLSVLFLVYTLISIVQTF